MKTVLKTLLWVLIGVTALLAAWAVQSGGSDLAISVSLYWGYLLLGSAVVAAIAAFISNVISHPAGLGKTLVGLGLVLVVVGVPVVWVLNRDILPVPNSAGGVFDNPFELRIAEIGLFVTYIVAVIAVLVVVFDVCNGLVRKVVKK
ncbi:MAG: hypothetical protein IKL20_06595 [Alistipes sp.]|nr:hypothetical protein [Alistipes sp.]